MNQKRICLISPGHIGSNPRLVKEATSLCAAGYRVQVIAGDYMAAIRPLDAAILADVNWSCTQVQWGSKMQYFWRRSRQAVARRLMKPESMPLPIARWAASPMSAALAQAAISHPADLYIAHNLAALPAAAIAARRHRARFGFDAEDFHVGELLDTPENQAEMVIRDRIERLLLPQCAHLTAASPGIAQAYADRYSVKMEPILNVFSLCEAPSKPKTRLNSEPSLYWFSQTIGAGRGLESILAAMAKMRVSVRLHLRGIPANGYLDHLNQITEPLGIRDRVHVLPPASPTEMVKLAAEHDVGLSLELTSPPNRAICLTNKIFTYLLAGLPVLMSNTPAQIELSRRLGAAAVVINEREPSAIAAMLDHWLSDREQFAQAKHHAWTLGQTQYNWDIEQHRFLSMIERALA